MGRHVRQPSDIDDVVQQVFTVVVAKGKEVQSFQGHEDVIDFIALSRDGRHALSANYDGSMRLPAPPAPAK